MAPPVNVPLLLNLPRNLIRSPLLTLEDMKRMVGEVKRVMVWLSRVEKIILDL